MYKHSEKTYKLNLISLKIQRYLPATKRRKNQTDPIITSS